jgi:SSS family solute:Na+ symporter
MLIIACLTAVYLVAGGYVATAYTNLVQGVVMLVGIVCLVIAVLRHGNVGGISGLIENLGNFQSLPGDPNPTTGDQLTSIFGGSAFKFLCVNIMLTSFGTWGLPQMVGKFYAIKDEKAITKGTVISTFFGLVVAGGCYFLGGFGRLYANSIELNAAGDPASFDAIIPAMLHSVEESMGSAGAWLVGLVLILVLAASMSTLSSLAMTSASTITLDLIAPLAKKQKSEKANMVIMRLLLAASIVIAAAIAILVVSNGEMAKRLYISDLMGISWGALAGCFLAPFLYGLYWKKTTKAAVWVSFATGLGITLTQFILNAVLKISFEKFDGTFNAVLGVTPGLILVTVIKFFYKMLDFGRVL